MSFVKGAPLAQGVLVPCSHDLVAIDDLVKEAEALWKAESQNSAEGALGANWGCVGVLFRSGLGEACDLQSAWSAYVGKAKAQCPPIVDPSGLSHIQWPILLSGADADLDVVLFTATRSEVTLPTAQQIADAWAEQSNGHEGYFFGNILHEVRTPNDSDIWERIKRRAPSWLTQDVYAPAIQLLQSEVPAERAPILHHMSRTKLTVGSLLKPAGLAPLDPTIESILESRRPSEALSRAETVYLSETPAVAKHGLPFDLGYLHKVEPCGDVWRADNSWIGELQMRHHSNREIRQHQSKALAELRDDELADKYWSGVASDQPNWEVLCRFGLIVRLESDEPVQIRPPITGCIGIS